MSKLLMVFACINGLGFILMGIDKWKAKHRAWRIPENVLLMTALLGGTLGVIAGMNLFHHKTRHGKFRYGMPALLLAQMLGAMWLLSRRL